MSHFEKLVDALKAAGEVTRLRLLALLADGELSVKDITDILAQSQPRVSRHLKLLAEAGLVDRNAEGAWVYYRIAASGGRGALVASILKQLPLDDAVLVADHAALEKVKLAHQAKANKYFAKVAQSWDKLRKLHVPESAVETAILKYVGPKRVNNLLDMGTGTGRMLELLSDMYVHGTGIDFSREMIGVARAKLAAAGISHAQIRLGDISEGNVLDAHSGHEANDVLDASHESVDLVILHQVLHYFDDPGHVLFNASSRLGTDGRILVVDFAPHDLEFLRERDAHRRLGLSGDQMKMWAQTCGLKVDHFEQFTNEHSRQATGKGLVVCLWVLSKSKEN